MAKRLVIALFTVLAATTITFVLIRNMPGDIIHMMALEKTRLEGIPYERALEEVQGMYGLELDQPLYRQFLSYFAGLLRGNLGISIHYKVSVNHIIIQAIPWTVFVLSIAVTLSFTLGTLIGMAAGWLRKGPLGSLISAYASITDATPDYITAIILLIIFAVNLKWFPLKGAYDADLIPGFYPRFILSVFHHAFLPIMAYTIENVGGWALISMANAVRVQGEDYIAAARAKGLKNRRIIIHYVGRNAILAPITSLFIVFGGMVGGATLIESVFAYPGMGFFFAKAVALRDYTMMQGLFLLTTFTMIMANFLADLLYSRLDPRVRLGE